MLRHQVLPDFLWSPWTVACQASGSMGFSSKNTGVGCHFLQGLFLTLGWKLHLLHCKQSLPLSHQRHPRRVYAILLLWLFNFWIGNNMDQNLKCRKKLFKESSLLPPSHMVLLSQTSKLLGCVHSCVLFQRDFKHKEIKYIHYFP